MHIFDVDHTITKGSTGRHYVKMAIRRKLLSRRILINLPFAYLRYRLGILKSSHIYRELPFLSGLELSDLQDIAKHSFSDIIKQRMYPGAISHIRSLQAQGETLAIATSSIDIIIRPLAEHLGIKHVVASSLEFIDGVCTGRFINAPTFSEQKRNIMLAFLQGEGVPPESCTFYSDSIYDLPLMEAVGTPVATNPDYLLARHAKRHGWRVLKFS